MRKDARVALLNEPGGEDCSLNPGCEGAARYLVGYAVNHDPAGGKFKRACRDHAEAFCRKNRIVFDGIPTLENAEAAHTTQGWDTMKSSLDDGFLLD